MKDKYTSFKQDVIKKKKKFDLEKKQRLNVVSLRNRFLAEWASNVMGYEKKEIQKYIKKIKKKNNINLDYNQIIKIIEDDFIKSKIKISSKEIEFKVKDFQMKANVIIENKLKLNSRH